jgi:heat shock protein HslJ
MKSMKRIGYLLLTVVVVLSGFLATSCKKEATETNMIIRNWTLSSKTIAGLNVATTCENDSKWNFKADGTYAIYDSCNNTQTGTWELASDAKTLTLDGVNAYAVVESTLGKLVVELQVGSIGLTRWAFN